MCGRITLKVLPSELAEFFDIVRGLDKIDFEPRYNVAPTTPMICVRETDEGREAFTARWGLVPGWARDKPSMSTFNARSDGISTKPMFRSAFKSRRCLVVASGFYEWHKITAKQKQPYYITLKSGEPMAIAGLWESYGDGEDLRESCTICTTDANPWMLRLHDRMPVILPPAMIEPWLDHEKKTADELQPILSQFPGDQMQCWPVSTDVGNVRNKGEHLIEPA